MPRAVQLMAQAMDGAVHGMLLHRPARDDDRVTLSFAGGPTCTVSIDSGSKSGPDLDYGDVSKLRKQIEGLVLKVASERVTLEDAQAIMAKPQ